MLPTSISPRAADDSGGKERLGDGREGGRERARRMERGRARARRGGGERENEREINEKKQLDACMPCLTDANIPYLYMYHYYDMETS